VPWLKRSGLFTHLTAMLFDTERKELERRMRDAGRLPPGQSATIKWPVLHVGGVPKFEPQTWDFKIWGLVEAPLRLNWKEFNALPAQEVLADMHCVTHWSRFDVRWSGVLARTVLDLVKLAPTAKFVQVHAEQGYTSNVPLQDLLQPGSLFATHHDGQPLPGDHGYPLRLVVPHLYAWKSVKWVRGLEILAEDDAGFWERGGYHMYGDPFREQRFSRD